MAEVGEGGARRGVELRPGMHIKPGDLAWSFERRIMPGTAGPVSVVVLHFEHSTGSTVLPVTSEVARLIAHDLTQAAAGIEVASELP